MYIYIYKYWTVQPRVFGCAVFGSARAGGRTEDAEAVVARSRKFLRNQ